METIYLMEDEFQYNCPYCGTEIIDYSKEKMENGTEYCGYCLEEYIIEIEECINRRVDRVLARNR